MKLMSTNGLAFSLDILGYQFPKLEKEDCDSNWLDIRIDVVHPRGNWSVTDACLLTYEVAEMADWFEGISSGEDVATTLGFIEPSLEFSLIDLGAPGGRLLRIYVEMELRPPWSPPVTGERVGLEFPLTEIDLNLASKQLREQVRRFPQRADR